MYELYWLVFFIMTITELQEWVREDWKVNSRTIPTKETQLLYVIEEFGEVAEAIRKTSGDKQRIDKEVDIGSEFADLIISTITLANSYDVDLTREIVGFKDRLQARHSNGF